MKRKMIRFLSESHFSIDWWLDRARLVPHRHNEIPLFLQSSYKLLSEKTRDNKSNSSLLSLGQRRLEKP